MSDFYQQLCNMLIRPSRQIYNLYDLGNPLIGPYGKRQDFQIFSQSSLKIKCSFYKSTHYDNNNNIAFPTIVYLHSLNGSRLEFLSYVETLLKIGFNIATLDFRGCGLSDGAYVTLGAHEKWDVLQLVKYINNNYNESNFMIWGRSMGAVAAIKFYTLFQQQRQLFRQLKSVKILGLVLDSPFSSLNQLAIQIAKNRINIPQIVIKMAFYMIQSSIQSKANFKTSQLQLQYEVKKIRVPTIILTSKKDTLVPYQHSLTIYNNISFPDKQLMYIQTQHNNNRQQHDIQKIHKFLVQKSKKYSQNAFHTGINQRIIQNLSLKKSRKKQQHLTLSKQKLSRNQSQKNQFFTQNPKNFFMSHVVQQRPIKIQQQNSVTIKHRARDFSLQRIPYEQQKVYSNKNHFYPAESQAYFSADRPKISFVNQISSKVKNSNLQQKQRNKKIDFNGSKLAPVPEQKFKQKPFNHSLSYKNIQCLKTVKKIKRLEPQIDEILNGQKQKDQSIKNHMNVITAKLKKKSKHILTKSFLPKQMIQNVNESMPQSEKTLKKQLNAKSSTIIEYTKSKNNRDISNINKRQKPTTPMCYSNRQLQLNQSVKKPYTPQFPLNSSMRINEIQKKSQNNKISQSSKQQILKMYSMQPMQPIYQTNRGGIKTTLKYNSNHNDQNNKHHYLKQTIQSHSSIQKPEFMSCKNMLSSQIISMRVQDSMNMSKKYIANKKPIIQTPQQTSIALK